MGLETSGWAEINGTDSPLILGYAFSLLMLYSLVITDTSSFLLLVLFIFFFLVVLSLLTGSSRISTSRVSYLILSDRFFTDWILLDAINVSYLILSDTFFTDWILLDICY